MHSVIDKDREAGLRLICPLSPGADDRAKWHAEKRYNEAIVKECTKIVEKPEFKRVEELQAKRSNAASVAQATQAEIDDIRQGCTGMIDDDAALDKAADKIAACERDIRRAELTVQSIDAVLPEALEARERVAKAAMEQVYERLHGKAVKAMDQAEASVDATVREIADRVLCARADEKMSVQCFLKGAEYVLANARRRSE